MPISRQLKYSLTSVAIIAICTLWLYLTKPAINNSQVKAENSSGNTNSELVNDGQVSDTVASIESSHEFVDRSLEPPDVMLESGGKPFSDNNDNNIEDQNLKSTQSQVSECEPQAIDVARTPANSPTFNYGYASDAALKERANGGDSTAQWAYAGRILTRLFNDHDNISATLEKSYRARNEVKTARNYLILALKNDDKTAIGSLPVVEGLNTPKPDYLSHFAWSQIYELMGGKINYDLIIIHKYSELNQEAKNKRVSNFLHAYNLWGNIRLNKNTINWAEGFDIVENSGTNDQIDFAAQCDGDYQSLTGIESLTLADISNYRPGEDPFIRAMIELEKYAKTIEEADFLAFPNLETDMAQAFKDIRYAFIISAKTGNRDALIALVDMHRNFEPQYDPVEALAWESIALRLGVDGVVPKAAVNYLDMKADEIRISASELAAQYLRLFYFQ